MNSFVTPVKDQSIEKDAVLSSLTNSDEFELRSLKFQIYVITTEQSRTCFLKSASIYLCGSLSIPLFSLDLNLLQVQYEKILPNTSISNDSNESAPQDIYSEAKLNLIADLSSSKSKARIIIECNKKTSNSSSSNTIRGTIKSLDDDSPTFNDFLGLFLWSIPDLTSVANINISKFLSWKLKFASIEINTSLNNSKSTWSIQRAQCEIETKEKTVLHDKDPSITLENVFVGVSYEDKRTPKSVFFYLKGQLQLGGVSVTALYQLAEEQIVTALIESGWAEKIQLNQFIEQFSDEQTVNESKTNVTPLPDAPVDLIELKLSDFAMAHLNLTKSQYFLYGQYQSLGSGLLLISTDAESSKKPCYAFAVQTAADFKFVKIFQSNGTLKILAESIDNVLSIETAVIYINSFSSKTIKSINQDIEHAFTSIKNNMNQSDMKRTQSKSLISPLYFDGQPISFISLNKDPNPGCWVYTRLKIDKTSTGPLRSILAICSSDFPHTPIELMGHFPRKSDNKKDQEIEFIGRNFELILLGTLKIAVREMKYQTGQSKANIDKSIVTFPIFSIDGSLSVTWDLSISQDKTKPYTVDKLNFNLKIFEKYATFSAQLRDITAPFGLSNITIEKCEFSGTYEFDSNKKVKDTSNYFIQGNVLLQPATIGENDVSFETKLYFAFPSMLPVAAYIDLKQKKVNLLQLLIRLLTLGNVKDVDFLDICVVDKIYGCSADSFHFPDSSFVLHKGVRFTIDFFELFQVLVQVRFDHGQYEVAGTAAKPIDLGFMTLGKYENLSETGDGPTIKYTSTNKTFSTYFSIQFGEFPIIPISMEYVFKQKKFIAEVSLNVEKSASLHIQWSKSDGFQWKLGGFSQLENIKKFDDLIQNMLNSMKNADACEAIAGSILDNIIKNKISASFQFKKTSTNANEKSKLTFTLIIGCTLIIGVFEPIRIDEIPIDLTVEAPIQVKNISSFIQWLVDQVMLNIPKLIEAIINNKEKIANILIALLTVRLSKEVMKKLACRLMKLGVEKYLQSLTGEAAEAVVEAAIIFAEAAGMGEVLSEAALILPAATAAGATILSCLNVIDSLSKEDTDEKKKKKRESAENTLQNTFNKVRDDVLTLQAPVQAEFKRSKNLDDHGIDGFDEILVTWEALKPVDGYQFTYCIMLTIPNSQDADNPFRFFSETSMNTIDLKQSAILTASYCEIIVQARCEISIKTDGKPVKLIFRGPGILWKYQSENKPDKPEDTKDIASISIRKQPNLPSPQLKSCTYLNERVTLEFSSVTKATDYKIRAQQNGTNVFNTTISQKPADDNTQNWSELVSNIRDEGGPYTFSVCATADPGFYDSPFAQFEQLPRQDPPRNAETEYKSAPGKVIMKWNGLQNVFYVVQSFNSSNIVQKTEYLPLLNPDDTGYVSISLNFDEIFPKFNDSLSMPWSLQVYAVGSSAMMNSNRVLLKDKISYVSSPFNIKLEADNINQQLNISFDHTTENSGKVKFKLALMNISKTEEHIEIQNVTQSTKILQWSYSSFQSSPNAIDCSAYQVTVTTEGPPDDLQALSSPIPAVSNRLEQLPKVTQCTTIYDSEIYTIHIYLHCPISMSHPDASMIEYYVEWSGTDTPLFRPFTISASTLQILSTFSRTDVTSQFDPNDNKLSIKLLLDQDIFNFFSSDKDIQGLLVINTITNTNIQHVNRMNSWPVLLPILITLPAQKLNPIKNLRLVNSRRSIYRVFEWEPPESRSSFYYEYQLIHESVDDNKIVVKISVKDPKEFPKSHKKLFGCIDISPFDSDMQLVTYGPWFIQVRSISYQSNLEYSEFVRIRCPAIDSTDSPPREQRLYFPLKGEFHEYDLWLINNPVIGDSSWHFSNYFTHRSREHEAAITIPEDLSSCESLYLDLTAESTVINVQSGLKFYVVNHLANPILCSEIVLPFINRITERNYNVLKKYTSDALKTFVPGRKLDLAMEVGYHTDGHRDINPTLEWTLKYISKEDALHQFFNETFNIDGKYRSPGLYFVPNAKHSSALEIASGEKPSFGSETFQLPSNLDECTFLRCRIQSSRVSSFGTNAQGSLWFKFVEHGNDLREDQGIFRITPDLASFSLNMPDGFSTLDLTQIFSAKQLTSIKSGMRIDLVMVIDDTNWQYDDVALEFQLEYSYTQAKNS